MDKEAAIQPKTSQKVASEKKQASKSSSLDSLICFQQEIEACSNLGLSVNNYAIEVHKKKMLFSQGMSEVIIHTSKRNSLEAHIW